MGNLACLWAMVFVKRSMQVPSTPTIRVVRIFKLIILIHFTKGRKQIKRGRFGLLILGSR